MTEKEKNYFVLRCSRGHEIDPKNPYKWKWKQKIEGDLCPVEIDWQVFGGSTYCRRVLKREWKFSEKGD